jgi:hypothetical protein
MCSAKIFRSLNTSANAAQTSPPADKTDLSRLGFAHRATRSATDQGWSTLQTRMFGDAFHHTDRAKSRSAL